MTSSYPLDDYLIVKQGVDIYRTDTWWKAVVQYHFEEDTDARETAVYLWYNDDGEWSKKNKYTIKTLEAWKEDNTTIEVVRDAPKDVDANTEFPVSDYYEVGAGVTVFKTNEWWKAIVRIDKKGRYETQELIIYVWQFDGDGWRRRQKYAIKNRDDWTEERKMINQLLDLKTEDGEHKMHDASDPAVAETPKLEELDLKIGSHLSKDLEEGW